MMMCMILFKRFFSHNPIRVCVVGSGPAGFYVAQHLLKIVNNCYVDIFDKLPVPFGLVRFGVAPDHPEVKNVINTFNKVAQNRNFRFFGHVNVGTDVTVSQLKEAYHIIVFAYGASLERKLNVKGEDTSKNTLSAKQMVSWYNGVPNEDRFAIPDLSTIETVSVLGHGNVALDIVRILSTPVDVLKKTDITQVALDNLANSRIRRIHLIGRRGPLNVSFTIKELRELTKMSNLQIVWNVDDFENVAETVSQLQRPRKRLTELMLNSMKTFVNSNADIVLHVHFYKIPEEIYDNAVRFCIGSLDQCNNVVKSDNYMTIHHDLLIKSIGYKSEQIDTEIPFDDKKGIIENTNGHIVSNLFSTGWVSTGPVGVLLATMNNAFETAELVNRHLEKHPELRSETKCGFESFRSFLKQPFVTWEQWQKIDQFEIEMGENCGKSREKILTVNQMLNVAHNE